MAKVVEANNLFLLEIIYKTAMLSTPITSTETWHYQMRYLGYNSLKKLTKVADEIVLSDTKEFFDSEFKKLDCNPCN
jgi:hypothetical protein